ncbi:MAG: hypothetical protein RMK62_08985 [Armatimonadota bacterium]|nr:hypothetical protein [Armatimonadota bacterium]
MASWRLLTGLIIVMSLLGSFYLWAVEGVKEGQMVRAGNFKDFSEAIAKAKSRTLVIDQPQPITSTLNVPADVHLFFVGEGYLKKEAKDRISVVVRAPITAPHRQIFIGFEPGEIQLHNSQKAIPQWWGAKADDDQDDFLAIQSAIDSGSSSVYLAQGRYIVSQTINITNRPGGGLIVHGDGFGYERGRIIYGNTRGILFDTSGSQYIEFRDLAIESGPSNPSTIAFLFARSAKIEYTKYAQFHSLTNVRVYLPSIPKANNGNGTVAVYNYAAEVWRAWNVYLMADQPLIFTGYNIFRVKSPFTELWSGYPSISECTVDGASTLHALGVDTIPQEYRVPAGLIRMSNGTRAVVYLDSRYLLGPEGAHLNITGISGLATKTSYAMFLLQSLLQSAERFRFLDKIGVIILNVKHGDLLTIDQPPQQGLEPEQKELWERLGLSAKPFENVRYLLPYGKETPRTRNPNSFCRPQGNWSMFAYSLQDTYDKLDLLLSQIPDPWDTINALVGEITQGLTDPRTGGWGPRGVWREVTDWNALLNGPPLVDTETGQARSVGDVRAVSVARFRRIMRRIVQTRQSGIFVRQRAEGIGNLSEEIGRIRGGEVTVVDIARLTDDEQTLVFGDILRTIYALYAEEGPERDNLPEKVIIFVDELNKYAPARERTSPILEQVLDIAERGRSLGVILFGAEQFMSAVHERVAGNCSTTVVGRTGSAELSAVHYRFLDPSVKAHITRLEKGELVLSHAIYRQPIKIVFPKPAYLQNIAAPS